MKFMKRGKVQDDNAFDLSGADEMPFGLTIESFDEYDDPSIRQRIKDAINDDTHPSTDADLDHQEMYDLGYIM